MNPTPHELSAAREWTTANLDAIAAGPPFSFVYGGKSSTALLPEWRIERKTRELDADCLERVVTWDDPETGLQVRCVATEYASSPSVEWVVYLKNAGAADTPILESIQALDVRLPCRRGTCRLRYSRGALCCYDDFAPVERVLSPKASARFTPGGGRSSSEVLPFFHLDLGAEGVVVAVGWTGEWAASFARDEADGVTVRAGMDLTHLKLHPGEEIRTPRILLLFWQQDRMRGHNLLRRHILAHHRPSVDGKPLVVPLCAGTWGGTPAATHLANVRQIAEHNLPFEYYWIDAEWFGEGVWWKNPGNWEVKADLYPDGFRPIADAVHAAGRKFLLWMEPERVCQGTPWAREHPQWLLRLRKEDERWAWPHFADQADPAWPLLQSPTNLLNEGDALLDLGNPAALSFLTEFVSKMIDDFGIDCYRHDANIGPLLYWRSADSPDRQGMAEIRWIEGLYAFWDELLRRHPGLMIDNCAGGGRRIDLEAIGRATPLWRSDFPSDTLAKQCHTYGLLLWAPLNATGALPIRDHDDYTLRSTMSSGMDMDYVEPAPGATPVPFEVARKRMEQYLAIRRYFYGDYYPLSEYSQAQDAWLAYQLDLPEEGEGLLVVLKRPLSPHTDAAFRLRGLAADAHYEVTNLDTGKKTIIPGKRLAVKGLPLHLTKQPDSALVAYRRVT